MKILIFNAVWCKTCKLMRPLWRNLKLEMPELDIKYFDADKDTEYCRRFNISAFPTIIFTTNNEKELDRLVEMQHKDLVIELINKYKNL